jgi:hypothetical protein
LGTDRLVPQLRYLLTQPQMTPLGLSVFIQLGFLLPVLLGTPFIYFNLIPRQKGIRNLRLLPFSPEQSATLLLMHFWKYELIYIIIIVPMAIAVGISLGFFPMLFLLLLLVLIPSLTFLFLHLLSAIIASVYQILFIYLMLVILYGLFIIFLCFYAIHYYIFFQLVILIFLGLYVGRFWPLYWEKWDLIIDRFRPLPKNQARPSATINYFTLAPFFPLSLRPIFTKEMLGQIRNRRYLRLKIQTLLFFLLGALLIRQYATENFLILLAALVVILIWWHYSSQFSEKYVLPEFKSFIKTMPLRYYQFVLPKFLSELSYVILLTCFVFLIFLFQGEYWKTAGMAVLSMFLVSALILLTMVIFKTLFYDKPRLAGYAYHFLILFCLVMSVNFYFVGPLITISLLLYFTYKSHQAFSN